MSPWIGVALDLLVCAIWYLIGRTHGREKAVTSASPYVRLAAPIFRALRTEGAQEVVLTVTRTGENEWTASSHTTVVRADS